MASTRFMTILAVIMVGSSSMVAATEHIVGGQGHYWSGKFDYKAWAKDQTFYVGDTLVFKYTIPNHNVYQVNSTAFQDCTIPAGTQGLATGNDVITLASPGKKWYICGKQNHCAVYGMKLAITVWDNSAPAPAPATSSSFAILASWFQVFVTGLVMIVA